MPATSPHRTITSSITEPVGIHRDDREYTRLVIAMFLAGIATFAQLYATQGVLPEIAGEFSVPASTAALSVGAATLGIAIGVLPWSLLADRLGTRRSLMLALAAAVIPGSIGPLLASLEAYIALRLIEGICLAGVPAVAIAFVLTSVRAPYNAAAGAVYIAGTTVGGLSGRLIAGPIAEIADWRLAVMVVMGVCVLATVGFALLLPRAAAPPAARAGGLAAIARLLADRRQLCLYAIAFLTMGGFVSLYNYLGFRLAAAPYWLTPATAGLVFIAYLAGTWSSTAAGRLIVMRGRRAVALGGAVVMAAGVAITLAEPLWLIVLGVVIATAGFFAVHAVASGWAPFIASAGKNQASALYNLAYYAGSAVVGWATGFAFSAFGWPGTVYAVLALVAAALVLLTTIRTAPPRE